MDYYGGTAGAESPKHLLQKTIPEDFRHRQAPDATGLRLMERLPLKYCKLPGLSPGPWRKLGGEALWGWG